MWFRIQDFRFRVLNKVKSATAQGQQYSVRHHGKAPWTRLQRASMNGPLRIFTAWISYALDPHNFRS